MDQALLDSHVQVRTPWAGQVPEPGNNGLSELSEGLYDQVPAAVSGFPAHGPWEMSVPL